MQKVGIADLDHSRKNHNLELFARMGGPFQRLFFEISIFGDDLIPEEVTELLGIEPSQSYKKGDERPRGSQYYRTGGWLLKSGEVQIGDSREGEEKFEEWLSKLPGNKSAWESLASRFEVKARLIGYTDQWNADYTISAAALNELSKRGLPLMIDPFLSLDEPDA